MKIRTLKVLNVLNFLVFENRELLVQDRNFKFLLIVRKLNFSHCEYFIILTPDKNLSSRQKILLSN